MAIMYPEKPKEFIPTSQEAMMFDALAKLPDSYYVFHSFSIVSVVDETVYESETDFVLFNPEKGILCLEAKAGQVKYEEGQWKYGSGIVMSHDGPFNQASVNKWKISKYIQQHNLGNLLERCKLMHAVWFPSIRKEHFQGVNLPPEADAKLMLTNDSMEDIEGAVTAIFDIQLPNRKETKLGNRDVQALLDKVLAPTFNLVSLSEMKLDHRRQIYKVMLKEQVALLNYLEEQSNAVINGMAGTGKTLMAIEKAKAHAGKGERVLFLCYNYYLKEYLLEEYSHENIFYCTIASLTCELCDAETPDYDKMQERLEEMYVEGSFPYQHIIIDEGQDFGKEQASDVAIIRLLKSNVLDDESRHGTFYLFCDKHQLTQPDQIPDYIDKAECTLTLYRNCRNTENIAITSLRLLGSDRTPKVFDGAVVGEAPEMYLVDGKNQTIEVLNHIIEGNLENGYQDIQILTCQTEGSSVIAEECLTGSYPYKGKEIPFTTCEKYKGLEADVVIMIDVNRKELESDEEQTLYVGSSRARYRLTLIAALSEDDCNQLLDNMNMKKSRNPGKTLAAAYNTKFREFQGGALKIDPGRYRLET